MSDEWPDAENLHVLMISLGDEVLTGWSDVQQRHLDYASQVSHLHMIACSPRSRNLSTTRLSDHLTVYPTRSVKRAAFIWDAYNIGQHIAHNHPINLITTQDPFATGLPGVWLKRRFDITLHIQNHNCFFDNPYWLAERPLRNRVFHRLGKWVLKRADTYRVVNHVEKDKYQTLGINPADVTVVTVPVQLERFTPGEPPHELRSALGLSADQPVLLWVGRPVDFKRVPTLIKAFALVHQTHPDAVLLLVGDFSSRADVRTLIQQHHLTDQVLFTGKVSHDNLPDYYRLARMYVHSSIYEGLGLVMVEAAACGIPVISTQTAGGMEVVRDGETGYLTPPDDPHSLAEKICLLLDNPDQAISMGAAGREYVLKKFDRARNIDAIIHTWQQTAARGGHA